MRAAPGCPVIGDDEALSGLLLPPAPRSGSTSMRPSSGRRAGGSRSPTSSDTGSSPDRPAGPVLPQGGRRPRGKAGERRGAPIPVTEQEANAFAAALLMPAPPDRALLPPDERRLRAALPGVQVVGSRDGAALARGDLRGRPAAPAVRPRRAPSDSPRCAASCSCYLLAARHRLMRVRIRYPDPPARRPDPMPSAGGLAFALSARGQKPDRRP